MGILDTVEALNKKAVVLKRQVGSMTSAQMNNLEFMKSREKQTYIMPASVPRDPTPNAVPDMKFITGNLSPSMEQERTVLPPHMVMGMRRPSDPQKLGKENLGETERAEEAMRPSRDMLPTPGFVGKGLRAMLPKEMRDALGMGSPNDVIAHESDIPVPKDGQVQKPAQQIDARTAGGQNMQVNTYRNNTNNIANMQFDHPFQMRGGVVKPNEGEMLRRRERVDFKQVGGQNVRVNDYRNNTNNIANMQFDHPFQMRGGVPIPKEGEMIPRKKPSLTYEIPFQKDSTMIPVQSSPKAPSISVQSSNPLFQMGRGSPYVFANKYVKGMYKGTMQGIKHAVATAQKVFPSEQKFVATPKFTSPEIYGWQNQAAPTALTKISREEKQYIAEVTSAEEPGQKVTGVRNRFGINA